VQPHIVFEKISKSFSGSGPVLSDFSLQIGRGEFIALLGPSGSGKSTLLRLIAGFEKADSGELKLQQQKKTAQIAFVFQEAHLMPWRNLIQNVELPLEIMGVKASVRRTQAEGVLKQVDLGDALHLYPSELSGGMKMRGSLARALIVQPELLLLDEPFAALDETTRFYLAEELRRLWISRRMTTILVTHSVSEASFVADRAVVLTQKPARIAEDFKIHLPEERRPELRGDAAYVQQMQKLSEIFRRANPRSES